MKINEQIKHEEVTDTEEKLVVAEERWIGRGTTTKSKINRSYKDVMYSMGNIVNIFIITLYTVLTKNIELSCHTPETNIIL